MRTSNPVLNDKIFQGVRRVTNENAMTIEGTVNRAGLAVLLTIGAGYWAFSNPQYVGLSLAFMIVGLVLALIISFKPQTAPWLAPVYAVVEGFVLGSVSYFFGMQYQGIVFQAVSLTFGVLFCMLMAYRAGWITVNDKFKMGVVAATGAIALIYLVSLVLSFFDISMPLIHSNGLFGIGFSLIVVGVAALNLALDFDLIEKTASNGQAPKYMEWYGAFALLVTLVWLYLEILRLLAKLQSRD